MATHPEYLERALHKVVALPKGKQLELFALEVDSILESHLNGLEDWADHHISIVTQLNDNLTASSDSEWGEEFALLGMALDEWKANDLQVGKRYARLVKKYSALNTVERKQILADKIIAHEEHIQKVVTGANNLADLWTTRLSKAPFDRETSMTLKWLASVSVEELKNNYERWEKEGL